MSKLKINERLIVRCYDHEQVKDVLNKLNELGYKTKFHEENGNIICFKNYKECFINIDAAALDEKSIVIWYKRFIKIYERQKEKLKKEPDLLVNKNGKILKINNIDKEYHVFYYDNNLDKNNGIDFSGSFLAEDMKKTDFYTSLEALEKALKRKEVENKLRALAFELNGNEDIDCTDNKTKYHLECFCDRKTISQGYFVVTKIQGTICCYSEDFKDKAIELIGEEDLKDYLMNY